MLSLTRPVLKLHFRFIYGRVGHRQKVAIRINFAVAIWQCVQITTNSNTNNNIDDDSTTVLYSNSFWYRYNVAHHKYFYR